MAAPIPTPDPDLSDASPDAAANANGIAALRSAAGPGRDALLRDLARALARAAAREAWAAACVDQPNGQETITP